jgi:uncharacterized protein (DUF433 family)
VVNRDGVGWRVGPETSPQRLVDRRFQAESVFSHELTNEDLHVRVEGNRHSHQDQYLETNRHCAVSHCTTMCHMADTTPSVQRSFRLSAGTSALLDDMAHLSNESRNALADRLLGEALRTERHPLIRFRTGAAGRREPFVVATRLLVRQIVSQVEDGDVEAAAEYLALPVSMVRAALAYYADFRDEVQADRAWAEQVEADERRRWERQQATPA